jgi:uncharacterized protein
LIPIRFGQPARQLFGLYEAPHVSAARGESILLCAPFGQEAIRSHRLFKVLADRLCREGFHVLRFDYFGTGDSAGEGEEVSIEGFIADVLMANNELANRSGCTSTSWMGLRLGASVAALASARVPNKLARLILWEPITDGAAYLRELMEAHAAALLDAYEWRVLSDNSLRNAIARESGSEALGFPVTELFRSALNALKVDSLGDLNASKVDIFEYAATAGSAHNSVQTGAGLTKQLVARGVQPRVTPIIEHVTWTADEMMNAASVPGEVLQKIVACVAQEPSSGLAKVNAISSSSHD